MIFGYVILAVAVTISLVAAYYSIMGLTAIFAAAVVPIIIMGAALELGKVVSTVWLHNNWRRAPFLFKAYLVPAVAFLMFLTSMGIFGFLSKAHTDQALVSGDVGAKIAIYDEKIKTARDNIETNRRALTQMDAAVDQTMGRSTDERGAERAVQIRRSQQAERGRLLREIETEQKKIQALNEEAAPIRAEVRKVEAEVGPIKYIAALVYEDQVDTNMLEKAVRWVIILIVIVFDPLALCLILVANKQFEWALRGQGGWVHDNPDTEKDWDKFSYQNLWRFWRREPPPPEPKPEEPAVDLDAVNRQALDAAEQQRMDLNEGSLVVTPDQDEEPKPFKGAGLPPAMPLTASYQQRDDDDEVKSDPWMEDLILAKEPTVPYKVLDDDSDPVTEVPTTGIPEPAPIPQPIPFSGKIYKFATDPVTGQPDYNRMLDVKDITEEEFREFQKQVGDVPAAEPVAEQTPVEPVEAEQAVEPVEPVATTVAEAAPGRNRGVINSHLLAQADNAEATGKPSNTGFGNEFPANPGRGDLFLRTDFLPNRLFKYNDKQWIEVDKSSTDLYAYDEMYIQYLIDQIDQGIYDIDTLSETEREQIEQYLKRKDAQ